MTTYPVENKNVTERGRAFLSTISSFWRELHGNKEMFTKYTNWLGENLAQRFVDLLYSVQTLSRHLMPINQTLRWKRLSFRESDLAMSEAGALKYGAETIFGITSGNFTVRLYGGRSNSSIQKLDINSQFVHASVLTDTPVEPTVLYACGTDFWFDRDSSSLQFRIDPFTVENMPIVDILDADGIVSDREISLWAFDAETDVDAMSDRFGILVGLLSTSSEMYSKLVNSALDMLVDGPSLSAFKSFMMALAGERAIQKNTEVVEDVVMAGEEWIVATDQNVYTFSGNATPIVEVGDTLRLGDMLSDAVEVITQLPQLESLDGLMLDERFCLSCDGECLGFGNEDVPVELTTVGGKTKISVALHGAPAAVRKFWSDVHDRGISSGTTLAEVLDLRAAPVGQPGRADLPKTINPLHLLLNEMRGSLIVVKVRSQTFSSPNPDIGLGTIIRRLLPARFVCLVLVEYDTQVEYLELNSSTSGSELGVDEDMWIEYAFGEALSDSLPDTGILDSTPGLIDGGVTIWTMGAPCTEE